MEENILVEIIKKLQSLRQEWKTVDAKQELILRENGDKAEFVKDAIAMANNSEQSYLIIGLEDKTFTPMGTLNRHYTKNDLNQVLADKTDPPLVVGYQEFIIDENEYAVIEIYGRNPPYIVARDLIHNRQDRKQVRIFKGTIYVRHGDRTEGVSRSELDALFKSELRRAYECETDYAMELAMNQPKFWEYLLTAELLQSKTARVKRALIDLDRGLIYKKAVLMKSFDFLNWASSQCKNLIALINLLKTAITEEMPASWGNPGKPGDPFEIKRAVMQIISGCEGLLEWETDLRSVNPPQSFMQLKQMMAGWTLKAFKQVEDLPLKFLEPIQQPNPEGQYDIEIIFEAPSNITLVMDEITRLTNHPEEWLDDYLQS